MLSSMCQSYVWYEREIKHLLAHTDQTIICSYHEQAVIWTAAKQPKDRGSQVPLMASQVGETNDFGLKQSAKIPFLAVH